MMEEEEEVLFDQAGLLTNRIKHGPEVKIHVTSIRVIKTFFLCAAFFGLVSETFCLIELDSCILGHCMLIVKMTPASPMTFFGCITDIKYIYSLETCIKTLDQ